VISSCGISKHEVTHSDARLDVTKHECLEADHKVQHCSSDEVFLQPATNQSKDEETNKHKKRISRAKGKQVKGQGERLESKKRNLAVERVR
jgi:hypothetical protein